MGTVLCRVPGYSTGRSTGAWYSGGVQSVQYWVQEETQKGGKDLVRKMKRRQAEDAVDSDSE